MLYSKSINSINKGIGEPGGRGGGRYNKNDIKSVITITIIVLISFVLLLQ